jgi:CDP-ribitol ribitolphosphotransferase / teichoic acid ribitol-phosphate polymerase
MLFKPGIGTRRTWRDRLHMPWLVGRADIILIDDYQPMIYGIPDGRARVVQLWHAVGAFKTVGYSRVGKPGAPDPWGRTHKGYTHAIVSGRADVEVYAEAFGIPDARVVPTGIPRMDLMFDPAHRRSAIAEARAAFPETEGRRVILFAPTFRGHRASTARYDMELVDLEALHRLCVETNSVCIVKHHPYVQLRMPLEIPAHLRDRILDGSRAAIDINDLLFIVDLLITDYSSVVFEYSTLGRPALFFAYDLEEYVADRDFYEPYDTFVPGRIVRTWDGVLDAIRREDFAFERMTAFAERHFDHMDAGSTDRVVDLIVGRVGG